MIKVFGQFDVLFYVDDHCIGSLSVQDARRFCNVLSADADDESVDLYYEIQAAIVDCMANLNTSAKYFRRDQLVTVNAG